MRSHLARLPGEAGVSVGHNGGPPLDPGTTWRRVAWTRARKALVGHVPLEVVRMRVRRARELGLAYPAYASILLGSGRDVVAFLFTAKAIGLRIRRTVDLPAETGERLRALAGCGRLLLAEPGSDARRLASALALSHRIDFVGAAAAPEATAPLVVGRAAVRALLAPLGLPGDGVVMVGSRAAERDWAEAARLARFLSASAYFAPVA